MGSLKQLNHRLLGLGIGLIGPVLILFGINVYSFPNLSFGAFLQNAYEIQMMSTWLKPAVLFNLAPFMLFINLERYRTAQGIVFGTIVYGLFIAYFTFF